MNTIPIETERQNLEVIPTTTATHYEPGKARMVYGFAYRCLDCHRIWLHRKEAVVHACPGAAAISPSPIVIKRVM